MNLQTLTRETVPALPLFGIDPDAEQKRNDLLLASRECVAATTQAEANSVGEAARDLRTFIASVREMGVSLRRPLRSACEQISSLEKDYLMPLEAEQGRLESLACAWAAAERRRVAEEQAARQAEIDRLASAALAAQTLTTPSDSAEDMEAARELSEAAKAKLEAAVRAPLPEAAKIAGMSTRKVMRWEVTDIKALAAARPDLVRMEPKAQAILSTCFPEHPVPGLRLWWEDATTTRRW